MSTQAKRAIGITRVSSEGDRETVHSYATQAARITADCERQGVQLLYIGRERNVSGGSKLDNRPELSKAVEAVERGAADLIVASYFDRFFRSLDVQSEVIKRIEAAGGEVLTLDHGQLTNATPAKRMTSNIMGAIAQYFREQTGEKVTEGHAAAVAAGKLPYPKVPLGYRKVPDGVLEPDRAMSGIVVELFERRARGESMHSLARWLTGQLGQPKSTTGVRTIIESRIYLGEIHFGEHHNLSAHDPIITPELWKAAQRRKSSPGRPALGEPRLLARLRLMRCGGQITDPKTGKVTTCGHLMTLGNSKYSKQVDGKQTGEVNVHPMYKCGSNPPCGDRQVISAVIAEKRVEDEVRAYLADAQGRASADDRGADLRERLAAAQSHLDGLIAGYGAAGLLAEPKAVAELTAARESRDALERELDELPTDAGLQIGADVDWDRLSLDARRNLIRTVVTDITIHPGRGADRVVVQLLAK